MNWKNGDYFGSSNRPLDEVLIPTVSVVSPDGISTLFVFKSSAEYHEFITWATWGLMENDYHIVVQKQQVNIREWESSRSEAEVRRWKELMDDFRCYCYGYYFGE